MNLDLEGKAALVTGSSGGIGEVIARTLAAEGAKVVVCGRGQEAVQAVAEDIEAAGSTAIAAVGDLATDEGAQATHDAAKAAFGRVDVLINNAGAYVNRPWDEVDADDFLETYNVNTVSALRMSKLVAPAMVEAGWGRLIHIATLEAKQPLVVMGDYASAKAAMNTMSVHISKVFAQTGITSNVISPGIVVTDAVKAFFTRMAEDQGWSVSDWEEIEAYILANAYPIASGRLGLPQDVADAVAFMASPKSQYINAANVMMDGGLAGTVL